MGTCTPNKPYSYCYEYSYKGSAYVKIELGNLPIVGSAGDTLYVLEGSELILKVTGDRAYINEKSEKSCDSSGSCTGKEISVNGPYKFLRDHPNGMEVIGWDKTSGYWAWAYYGWLGRNIKIVQPDLKDLTITPSKVAEGEVVRVSATAINCNGQYLSPYGDPRVLEYLRKSTECISGNNTVIWAEYRLMSSRYTSGDFTMKLEVRENKIWGGKCDGLGRPLKTVESTFEIVKRCVASDLVGNAAVYNYGGPSAFLNRYCEEKKKSYILTVSDEVSSSELYGTEKPPSRTYNEIISGWEKGIEKIRKQCPTDNSWYWVSKPAALEMACPDQTFVGDAAVYKCGGRSDFLNRYCEDEKKSYILTVSDEVSSSELYGTEKPPSRTYNEIISGWEKGIEKIRKQCPTDNSWYWVSKPATLEVVRCVAADFVGDAAVYNYGGPSAFLNRYCEEKKKSYILTVSDEVSSSELYGTEKPPSRTYNEIISGWEKGIEKIRKQCPTDKEWYWVSKPAALEIACPDEAFIGDAAVYKYGGPSAFLNRYCEEKKKSYILTVSDEVSSSELYGTEKPPSRTYNEIISGWEKGIEKIRKQCPTDNSWHWVSKPAALEIACPDEEFRQTFPVEYFCRDSPYLDEFCKNERVKYRLAVDVTNVLGVELYGTELPPPRDYNDVVSGWRSGYELQRRQCESDGSYNWVKYPAQLEVVCVIKIDFYDGVVTFLGCPRSFSYRAVAMGKGLRYEGDSGDVKTPRILGQGIAISGSATYEDPDFLFFSKLNYLDISIDTPVTIMENGVITQKRVTEYTYGGFQVTSSKTPLIGGIKIKVPRVIGRLIGRSSKSLSDDQGCGCSR